MSALTLVLVPAAPLAAGLLLLTGGRFLARVAGPVCVAALTISLAALLNLSGQTPVHASLTWTISGGLPMETGLLLDRLGLFMAVLVAGISLLVHLYACGYMAEDPRRVRFFSQFAFFSGAMLVLVLADSFVLLFAAWEWVGLASFLLIGFWHTQAKARNAARRAFIMTRLGDVGFLLGWLLVWVHFGTQNIDVFLQRAAAGGPMPVSLTLIAGLLLIAALGKSAQLPLSAWLPPAMAGPTPVSALIHSATMVAAGIYLILRLFPLFAAAPGILTLMLWLGAATALFAALAATVQNDLKRVLAWSTVSQLGEMLIALGLSAPLAAVYHLAVHGVFKSTLFLAAGAVDHATGTRELSRLGGLAGKMPLTAMVFGVAALSLAGVPLFSGFFSADHILAAAVEHHVLAGALLLLIVFLAGSYISRAWAAVFASWPGMTAPEAGTSGPSMRAAMVGLSLLAIGIGGALSGSIAELVPFGEGPSLGFAWKTGAVLASLSGLALGWARVRRAGPLPVLGYSPARLEQGLESLTVWTARAVSGFAGLIRYPEKQIDRWALGLARLAGSSGAALQTPEAQLDRQASDLVRLVAKTAAAPIHLERQLDRLGGGIVLYTFRIASNCGLFENKGFSNGLDRGVAVFGRFGSQAGALHNGKVYAYTLALFVWVFLMVLFAILVWTG